MTQETNITLGAIQFDDLNEKIFVPFTVSNMLLGNQNGPTKSIDYTSFGESIGNANWITTMPYSEIKSAIKALMLSGIGTVKVS